MRISCSPSNDQWPPVLKIMYWLSFVNLRWPSLPTAGRPFRQPDALPSMPTRPPVKEILLRLCFLHINLTLGLWIRNFSYSLLSPNFCHALNVFSRHFPRGVPIHARSCLRRQSYSTIKSFPCRESFHTEKPPWAQGLSPPVLKRTPDFSQASFLLPFVEY